MIAKGERGLRCRIAFRGGDKRTRRRLRDSLRSDGLDAVVEADGPGGTAVTIWYGLDGYAPELLAGSLDAVLGWWPIGLQMYQHMTATVRPRERTR